jgi:Golgi apparatus protein 1
MRQLVFVLAAAFCITATAQEALLDYVIDSCEGDITDFCDTVTPGDGRIAFCIAAHEDKISDQCTLALYQAAGVLRRLVDDIAYLAAACSIDIEENCADTEIGEGRIMACLADQDVLSASCSAAIEDVVEE